MADKNFIVKNGLTVGSTERISSAGVITGTTATQSVGNSSTLLATTAYVRGEIDALIDSAPGTLNTLDELAAAINDDAQFNTTLTDAVALKAPLASPTFTGNVSFPDDTIDLAHMSANSVDSDQYVDGSIDAEHLAPAQTNITSLGTLTALTVDNLGINGNTITANSGALNLTPASGSAIVLDGTINVDAGVVTGATSITSTAFVGNITGDLTGTLQTAAQGNVTSLGTLTTLTVDDITLNNSTISDGGVLTFDAGGDIELDAGGDNWWFDAGGTRVFSISNVSSDIYLGMEQNDKDMIFRGKSSGSAFTALTLDMSNSGAATFAAPILAPAGSAAAPSYAFSAQASTGMYKPGTNQLYFSVGGTRKIRVEASQIVLENPTYATGELGVTGDLYCDTDTLFADASTDRVGINVGTSPLQALDIQGYIKMGSNRSDDSEKHAKLMGVPYDSGSTSDIAGLYINGHSGGNFLRYGGGTEATSAATTHTFYTAALTTGAYEGTRRFYIHSDGNVAVGNQGSPSAKLHVYTAGAEGINIGLQNSERYWKMQTDGGYLTFNDVSAGDLARMVLDTNGKVGIGTSSPTRQLHVVGDEDLTDFTSTTKGQFCLSNSDYASGEYVAMDFTYTGSDLPIARIGAKLTGSGSYLSLGTSNNYSNGVTNEALVIDYSGNVGIGVTPSRILEVQLTPVNASLHNTTGATAHFGGTGNTDGYIQGISLGYKSSAANTYIKTAIVARGRGDGAARQDLAFLVDTDADAGSAEIGNSVLTFDGLTGRGDFRKSAYISTFALTSASTVSWDAAAIANAYITLGHNVTIDQPSNPVHGAVISLEIKQPSSGGPYTVAWHADFEFAASTAPTVTATASKTDIFTFRYSGSQWQEIGRSQNMAQS